MWAALANIPVAKRVNYIGKFVPRRPILQRTFLDRENDPIPDKRHCQRGQS